MAGPPIIQPKAGVPKAPELSPYYNYIYKLEPQCLFARVCTLHTLAALYIYTLEDRRSFACSCSLHTLSPSPDLNKTSLASLSPLTAGLLVVALFTLSTLFSSKQDFAGLSLSPLTAGQRAVRQEGKEA